MKKNAAVEEQTLERNLLNVEDASRLLRVAPKTIRNWQYQGRLPYVKVFGAVRFKRSDLETLIEEAYKG